MVNFKNLSEKKIFFIVFLLYFATRFCFYIFTPYDNFQLQVDSYWYNEQSNDVLNKNFNLLRPLFITAPFFSYFQALIKFIFQDYWKISLTLFQITACSFSGIYFFKLTKILFNKNVAILSSIIFCFYPLTLWFSFTFTQDIWFQCFLIFFLYHFNSYLIFNEKKSFYYSIIFFSLTYLTKSHILLFSPFIVIIFFLKKEFNFKKKVKISLIFATLTFAASLPYGIYNLKANGTYVISSSGFGGTFIIGHNEEAYLNHIKRDELTPEQKRRFKSVNYQILEDLKPLINKASPSEIQKIYFNEGLRWIKNNPLKSFKLALDHFKSFFKPGINKFWYDYKIWLTVLIISSPIYFFSYLSIYTEVRRNYKKHFWIVGLMVIMLFFSIFFYYSGRFIVITLEPYYIIYSCKFIHDKIISRIKLFN